MGFGSLLRRVARLRQGYGAQAPRGSREDEALAEAHAAFDALRRDVRALRKELANTQRHLDRTERQAEQLLVLRQEDAHAAERLDRLAPIMDLDSAARYARDAIAGARRIDEPVPHLVIAPLLPSALYDALLEAIPSHVFFAPGRSGLDEWRVSQDLAPLHVAATWKFVARLVRHAITPALLDAFAEAIGERPARPESEGCVVRRAAGPGLARRGEGGRRSLVRLTLALAPEGPINTAVAFVPPAGAHEFTPLPENTHSQDARYSYELVITARPAAV